MIVLDTSAAVEIVRGTEQGARLAGTVLEGEPILSVDLLHAEVASAFSKYVRAGYLGIDDAVRLSACAVGLVDRFVPMSELYVEALREAIVLGHSPYDMFYFVLARRTGATLLTCDKRLIDLAMRSQLNCVFQAELEPGETWTIRSEVEGR